jgi:hypothetical protein
MFAEHPDYARVFDYLESVNNFFYVNCSNIADMPPVGGKEAIRSSLRDQIRAAETLVLITSMYQENRDLIDFEINAAKAAELPIVGLEPFGGGKVPDAVAGFCDEVVGWNDRLIVDAIRRQARHEQTSRWDVIEFDMS